MSKIKEPKPPVYDVRISILLINCMGLLQEGPQSMELQTPDPSTTLSLFYVSSVKEGAFLFSIRSKTTSRKKPVRIELGESPAPNSDLLTTVTKEEEPPI